MFRYASLASSLDIVPKTLSHQEIAADRTIQVVGIAGDDDLDAPDAITGSPVATGSQPGTKIECQARQGVLNRRPVLDAHGRERLVGELAAADAEGLLVWFKDGFRRNFQFSRSRPKYTLG
ncbi:hypothetical protein IVB15_09025 [Bradyrhizobium sp. 182]|uniref:hypothetical protein n=1 Tax=unclassified Bradyrhizobium TaxID=2631580 RepID=UPI001FF756AE|nr:MULTISPECIES: hypothetical protein [unclassified Bradyrhizobium]MCK1422373.1 hypothetical protein [Bradyrhizobium sp. CW12]MCK1527886.1 hypothetical protein [Bradyrhizobium sp. 182]MCK1649081.1 hypothetical protein [Bradyrhizobium sp. 154]